MSKMSNVNVKMCLLVTFSVSFEKFLNIRNQGKYTEPIFGRRQCPTFDFREIPKFFGNCMTLVGTIGNLQLLHCVTLVIIFRKDVENYRLTPYFSNLLKFPNIPQ